MDEADAEEAAELFDAEALAQVQRVVISVPGENAALTEKLRDFRGMVIADADRHRGAALVETAGIADAEEAKLGNREQAVDQAREQGSFVLMCYAIRGKQGASAIGCARVVAAAELSEVIDCCANAGDQLLDLRAGFPSVGERIVGRAYFVWLELQQALALAVERAHVRAEEFVGRADQEIAIERADIDWPVGRVVDGIDEPQRAGFVSQYRDFRDGADGANGVGSVADGDKVWF